MIHPGGGSNGVGFPYGGEERQVGAEPTKFDFSERRLKDLMLYVSEKLADDPTFGETKLNKALFFSDFEAYRLLGKPITGAEYQKNKYGPTARLYTIMRDELLRTHQIKSERKLIVDHVQDVLSPRDVRANMDQFSPEEIAIVDRVIEEMRQYNNTEISDKSHEQSAGWRAKKQGETIHYETALIDPEPADAEALAFLRKLEGISA